MPKTICITLKDESLAKKLEKICFMKRQTVSEIMEELLKKEAFLYENEEGKIQPVLCTVKGPAEGNKKNYAFLLNDALSIDGAPYALVFAKGRGLMNVPRENIEAVPEEC